MSSASDSNFVLHPKLHADTLPVADLPLCKLALMNDSRYPWFILIPRRLAVTGATAGEYLRDMSDLPAADHAQFFTEVMATEKALKNATNAHKMNVAVLSNEVQQLHVHVIARSVADAAWPAPVWGKLPAVPYQPSAAGALIARVKSGLASVFPDYI